VHEARECNTALGEVHELGECNTALGTGRTTTRSKYLFYCINPTCFHEIKKATVLFLLEQNQSENPQCMNALSHFFVKSIAKWRSRSWINL